MKWSQSASRPQIVFRPALTLQANYKASLALLARSRLLSHATGSRRVFTILLWVENTSKRDFQHHRRLHQLPAFTMAKLRFVAWTPGAPMLLSVFGEG